jgi:hypothetical protein
VNFLLPGVGLLKIELCGRFLHFLFQETDHLINIAPQDAFDLFDGTVV